MEASIDEISRVIRLVQEVCDRWDDPRVWREYFLHGACALLGGHAGMFLADYGGALEANPEEIAAIRWITFADLQTELLTHPQDYSAWFLIAAPKVLQFLMRDGRFQAILG